LPEKVLVSEDLPEVTVSCAGHDCSCSACHSEDGAQRVNLECLLQELQLLQLIIRTIDKAEMQHLCS
jgi:hypothetical protein